MSLNRRERQTPSTSVCVCVPPSLPLFSPPSLLPLLCHVCPPPLVSIGSIFSTSRLVTWQEEEEEEGVNNVVVGGGRERERE